MYIRAAILTILLVFSLATVALSQPPSDKGRNERSEWETELQRVKRDKPKAYEFMKRASYLATQRLLGRLGYGVGPYNGVLDEKTKNALREYQRQRNLPITGDPLSFETVEQIKKDTNLLDYQPTTLPGLHVFLDFWESGYVSGKGTWVLTNAKSGLPEQTTYIECQRDQHICIESTAILSRGTINKHLQVNTDRYEIERWDAYEIVTKPRETLGGCVRYVLKFNRVQKSVSGLRSTISTEGLCKGVDTKELHMILSDGIKVHLELWQTSVEEVRKLFRYSPEMIEFFEQQESK